jgi:hypothetical protein
MSRTLPWIIAIASLSGSAACAEAPVLSVTRAAGGQKPCPRHWR